jgi:RNA-binding protein
MNTKELKSKAAALDPVVRVGKNGLTESTMKEITRQLHKKKLIKIKFLPAYLEGKNKKEEGKKLAAQLKAQIIHQVGFVVVLYKT